MIARTLPRPQPIPFADRLSGTLPATSAVRWTPPPPLASAPHTPTPPMRPPVPTPVRPAPAAAERLPSTEPLARVAQARYDGAHALSVRSSATGRLYRFTHPGAVEMIDAADIALMRRIDSVTVL